MYSGKQMKRSEQCKSYQFLSKYYFHILLINNNCNITSSENGQDEPNPDISLKFLWFMFMDLDSILIQKQGKKEICQFLAFWTFQWLELSLCLTQVTWIYNVSGQGLSFRSPWQEVTRSTCISNLP